jgi:phage shock protein A
MKSETRNALLKAYTQLQQIIDDLYEAANNALENDDFEGASLLATRADKLYEEAENLEFVISELEDK